VLTKTRKSEQIEHLAFRLSSLLTEKSGTQLEDYDFSWLDVFTKKGKEDFKNQLYQAISKSINTGDWSFVEEVVDSWYETAEIKSNKSLVKRIKKGSEEARRGESKSWEEFQKELE
jgi:hypothetical protein